MSDFKFPFVPTQGTGVDWQALIQTYPWLEPLDKTPQNLDYHGEGDVGSHTRMVLEELVALGEWRQLPATDRGVLFWAALLHDIAKPACTRMDPDGRIRSPNHTVVGERMAREVMYKGIPDPVPFDWRERVAKLVRHHGLPRWLIEQENPTRRVIQASLQANLKHVALLAEADNRGRISSDLSENIERVEFFRQFARETGCYDRPYPFETDLARVTYLKNPNGSPAYVPHDSTWAEVLLMSGLPGAGKDTWIRENAGNLPMVSLDCIRDEVGIGPEDNQGRVIQTAKSRAKAFLRKKEPFVWNATNVTRHLRKPLIDLFHSYGARVRIVYVEAPYRALMQRNQKRDRALPADVLERLVGKLDVPGIVEAERVEYG